MTSFPYVTLIPPLFLSGLTNSSNSNLSVSCIDRWCYRNFFCDNDLSLYFLYAPLVHGPGIIAICINCQTDTRCKGDNINNAADKGNYQDHYYLPINETTRLLDRRPAVAAELIKERPFSFAQGLD